MSEAYIGGCACGGIRYVISDEPIASVDCQCRDCQHTSGTGHGSYLTFPDRNRVVVEGKASFWDMTADSGNVKTRAFCPTCGSPVYINFSAAPELFTIHAASLDDAARYRPEAVIYTIRGHDWDQVDPVLPKFEKMPAA